jgi:hypothetical protein
MATVDIGRITAEAREVQFRRAVLTALASVLYAVGWIVRKVFAVLWLVLTWSWTAIRLGWQDAGKPPRKP